MALYKVVINKNVRKKDLPKIPAKTTAAIVKRIIDLASNPRPADSVQLKGRSERRIRQGNHRILYVVHDDIVTVLIVKVGHRGDVVYRS